MSTHTQQDRFEKKVEKMSRGFSTFPLPNARLTFRHEELTPPQVVHRLEEIVRVIRDAQEAEKRAREAAKACAKAMPKDHTFYEEAVAVVTRHFGSDPRTMASFGLRAAHHHRHAPSPEIVVVEVPPPAPLPEVEVRESVQEEEVAVETSRVQMPRPEPMPRRPRQPHRHHGPERGTRR